MRIAIVRLTSLGDIIFCMASLQAIRRRFPDCSITWFADSKFADVLDYNPDLASIVKLNLKGMKKAFSVEALKAEYAKVKDQGKFDVVIDMHGMLKSAAVGACLGSRRAGFHRSVAKEPLATLLYTETHRIPFANYAVFRFASLAAAALGFELTAEELRDGSRFLFHGSEDAQTVAPYFAASEKVARSAACGSGIPAAMCGTIAGMPLLHETFSERGGGAVANHKNVVLVPGTSIGYKNYPKERYLEVVRKLDAQVLVCHGGESEREVAEYLAGESANVRVLPRMTLNQLKAAVGMADLVIGGDTGPTHMAWASCVPSITLYGGTPANCVYPRERNRVITSGTIPTFGKADSSDFSIANIEPAEILRHAEELL